MKLDIAAALCRRFEGFRSKPYLCPAGVPTIGYGSTYYPGGRKVTLQDSPVSEEVARAMLMHELAETYAPGVIRQCPGLLVLAMKTNDWRTFNAIVDFAYNLGVGNLQISTLRRKLNEQNWPAARAEILRWNKAGGRVLAGLTMRRQAEAELISG